MATAAWLAASGLIGWKTALANTPDASAEDWMPADVGVGNMFVKEVGGGAWSPTHTTQQLANISRAKRLSKV